MPNVLDSIFYFSLLGYNFFTKYKSNQNWKQLIRIEHLVFTIGRLGSAVMVQSFLGQCGSVEGAQASEVDRSGFECCSVTCLPNLRQYCFSH